jgi:hypothetical protein
MAIRSPLLLLLVFVACLFGAATLARPADAATQRCTPSNNSHTTVVTGRATIRAQVCVIRFSGRRYKAWLHVTWSGSLRSLVHWARLEDDLAGRDKLLGDRICGIPPGSGHQLTCQTAVMSSNRRGITGDGSLTYDLAGDGRGSRTVQLHGSPSV